MVAGVCRLYGFIHKKKKKKKKVTVIYELSMIFLKDLDLICPLSFYISKQSRTKVRIQTWIPLRNQTLVF